MTIREARFAEDGAGILTLDTRFTTETVFDVETDGEGFVLRERRLDKPLTKRLPLDDLTASGRSWSHAFVSDEGKLSGFAAAGFAPWNKRLTLWHLYVRPDRRRAGIGRALVDRVAALGGELGARHLWLETSNVNPPAVAAYRAMGFALTGVDLTLYDRTPAEGEVALFMSRRL